MSNFDILDQIQREIMLARHENEERFLKIWNRIYDELQKPNNETVRKELLSLFKVTHRIVRSESDEIVSLLKKPKIRRVK